MFMLKIQTHNQAFENSSYEECARILEITAEKLREGNDNMVLIDSNGNVVGKATLTKR